LQVLTTCRYPLLQLAIAKRYGDWLLQEINGCSTKQMEQKMKNGAGGAKFGLWNKK
jgi:hypothetical protein